MTPIKYDIKLKPHSVISVNNFYSYGTIPYLMQRGLPSCLKGEVIYEGDTNASTLIELIVGQKRWTTWPL